MLNEVVQSVRMIKPHSKLQQFHDLPSPDPGEVQSEKRSFFGELTEGIRQQKTIHGVRWLQAPETACWQRFIWSLILVIASLALMYAGLLVVGRFHSKELQTVIESTRYPVYKIPFPEVTVCNNNRLNWARLEEAKKRFLSASHHTGEWPALFENIVARYDSLSYGGFDVFANLSSSAMALRELNYVNFSSVVHLMAWRCDELFEECFWQRQRFNCCEIIYPRISQMGPCLAFNSIESRQGKLQQLKDSKWPWRVGKYGPESGLKVKLQLRENQHSPHVQNKKGITFMLCETYVWYNVPLSVQALSQVKVSIKGMINIRDQETRSVSAEKRGCVFADEKSDKFFKRLSGYDEYMFENCESECQQESLMQYCNCTMDLFFPPAAYPVCKTADLPCLAEHNFQLRHFDRIGESDFAPANSSAGIACTCLLKCALSLRYTTNVVISDLKLGDKFTNQSYIEMDLYYHNSFLFVYRTALVFTWLELLVAVGGLVALFLGCSIVSLAEFLQFIVVDLT